MAERWKGRVALVTGASAGIGLCVTKALAARGMKVVACARNITAIEELSRQTQTNGGAVRAVKCDVSSEDDVAALFRVIRQNPDLGSVHVCINNAGLAHPAPLLSGKPADWRHMFMVNVLGLMMCTKESFQLMKEKDIDDGHIILINSMSGHRLAGGANAHCYSATKCAVTALAEGIRRELRELKSHIRLSQISPGFVETEFASRMHNEEAAAQTYSAMKCLQSKDISDAVLYLLDSPPHAEIHDILMRPTEQAS